MTNGLLKLSFVMQSFFSTFSLLFRKQTEFRNDVLGTNAVSWAPYSSVGSQLDDGRSVRRLVTGSCDGNVRIWRFTENGWVEEIKSSLATPHTGMSRNLFLIYISFLYRIYVLFYWEDWVRDVAWAPNTGIPYGLIASCSEDKTVLIWKQSETDGYWNSTLMATFEAPVWRVSFSGTGNVLAVSTGDHTVTLWKQGVDETWIKVSGVNEGGVM